MKLTKAAPVFLAGLLILAGCAGEVKKIIFHPPQPVSEQILEYAVIVESQSGGAGAPIPEWVNSFLRGGIDEVESMAMYNDSYIFIGENRGTNFNAMRQWSLHYSAKQDLPRLAAIRIEKKMYSQASLYPDDEYGDFFESLVKSAANEEYSHAIREASFWIKQAVEEFPAEPDQADPVVRERYVFFVLISVDKANMQKQIREMMDNIKTGHPTKEQAAAINHLKHNFFEGF
jgi:hypothetical protein